MGHWYTIEEFRRRLLWPWHLGGGLLLLLLLLQSIFGQYAGMLPQIWLWSLTTVLVLWFLILLSAWINRRPEKLVARHIVLGLVTLSIVHLLFALITVVFSEVAIQHSEATLGSYFRNSYWWMLPSTFILAIGLYLTLLRKHNLRPPNAAIIKEKAAELHTQSANRRGLLFARTCALVAEGQLLEAAKLITQSEALVSDDRQAGLALQSQLAQLQREIDLGLIEEREAQRRWNRLALALLNLAEQLKAPA